MTVTSRTLNIILGAALAVSVAINLFAATAAYTAVTGQNRIERRLDDRRGDDRHGSTRELVAALSPDVRDRVRRALRAAGTAARPDFQQAREFRAQAMTAAAVEPLDVARVDSLLDQSRDAEIRGRERLEAEALTILATLGPADRAVFSHILNRGKGGGRDDRSRDDRSRGEGGGDAASR